MALVEEEKQQEQEHHYIRVDYNSDEDDDDDDYKLVVRREMTDEEYKEYWKQVTQSKGFDVQSFEGTLAGGIVPCSIHGPNRELMIDLSKQALQLYNEQNNASYEFVELVKGTHQCVAGEMFYITFAAAVSNDTSRTFRAKVWHKLLNRGSEIKFCEMI